MTDKRWLHQANLTCFSPPNQHMKNLHSISVWGFMMVLMTKRDSQKFKNNPIFVQLHSKVVMFMSFYWLVFKFVTIAIVLALANFVSKLNKVVMGMHHNCTVTDNSKGTAISQLVESALVTLCHFNHLGNPQGAKKFHNRLHNPDSWYNNTS